MLYVCMHGSGERKDSMCKRHRRKVSERENDIKLSDFFYYCMRVSIVTAITLELCLYNIT